MESRTLWSECKTEGYKINKYKKNVRIKARNELSHKISEGLKAAVIETLGYLHKPF